MGGRLDERATMHNGYRVTMQNGGGCVARAREVEEEVEARRGAIGCVGLVRKRKYRLVKDDVS
jgi:hypothetical protein